MARLSDSDMWNENTPRMRIGLVGDGRSIHIRRWGRWLKTHGHYVAMLSTTDIQGEDIQAELKEDYDMMWTIKIRTGPLSYLAAIIMLKGFVKEYKLDVAHGMYLTSGGFLASFSGARVKVVSAWGSDVFQDAKKSRLKRMLVKYALKHSDMVFASSIGLEEAILMLCPKVSAQITRYGTNLEHFRPRGTQRYQRFTFLSIRRSEDIYRPMEILQAFEEVASGMDARLLLQRPGSKNHDLMLAVWNSPFRERIGFWDERKYESMADLYGAAHVGVSIPESDGCSAAVMECMACGTPVISPLDGDVELVNPLLSADSDSHHHRLADAMRFAYRTWEDTPLRWSELAEEARATAERFGNFDLTMRKVVSHYQDLTYGGR